MREAGGFLLFCIAVAIGYGIAHDLVTAHLSVEYFTVHHPTLVESESPVVMALPWGVLATWWVGGGTGLLLIVANCVGSLPSVPWPVLRRRVLWMVAILLVLAMLFLLGLWLFANSLPVARRKLTFEHDRDLVVAASTHVWSYGTSASAAAVLVIWTLRTRFRMRRTQVKMGS